MNAIKLLGSLMGNQSLASGLGGKLLGGLLGGGGQQQPQQQAGGGLAGILSGALGGGGGGQSALGGLLGGGGGGIGGLLGSVMGGGKQEAAAPQAAPAPEANDQAVLMIRAMVNAAKSDGRVDEKEQENIISKLGSDVSPDEIEFLKKEFAAPLDVASFASSIPSGLEQQIYALSLTSIDLDTNTEAQYLGQLAQGLKLDPNLCNQIHDQLGAPKIFG